MSEQEKRFKRERGGGNYGVGTKEMQARNKRCRPHITTWHLPPAAEALPGGFSA